MAYRKDEFEIVDKNFIPKNAEEVLLKARAEIIKKLRESIQAVDRDSTGRLKASVDGIVVQDGSKLTLQILMEDYWKFVNDGVNGYEKKHGSPYNFKNDGKPANIGAMMEFIRNRDIKEYRTPSGKLIYTTNPTKKVKKQIKGLKSKKIKKAVKQIDRAKRVKTLAYLIGKRIKKVGIKPTHFLDNVISEGFQEDLSKQLSDMLKIDIELYFTR